MKVVSATASNSEVEQPSRRFGTPSRLANSKPYSKPSPSSKNGLKTSKDASYVASRSPSVARDDQENFIDATHANLGFDFSGNASTLISEPNSSGDLTANDLNLPPFNLKAEPDATDLLHGGALANGSPDGPEVSQNATEDAEDIKNFNYDETVLHSDTDEQGMPTRAEFARITNEYVQGLHERKRDKALITHAMHCNIFEALAHPEATRVGSPQFRFWARKMFQLVEAGDEVKTLVITHGGRPVAVREQIYDILCMAHRESCHAGRDKTCKILREYYTWIPKELTANFVKACPTCQDKRSRETIRRIRFSGREGTDKPSTPSMVDGKAKTDSRNFMHSLSLGGPNDALQNTNYPEYSSGEVSVVNTPVCSQGSFAQAVFTDSQGSQEEMDDKSNVTLLGDAALAGNNNSYMHHGTRVSFEMQYSQTPQAQSQQFMSPTTPFYPFTPEHDFPSQITHTSTPYPSANSDAMYNYGTPLHRAPPPMTPLPPLLDHLSKTGTASPSLEGQAVLPRIRDGNKSKLYTLATSLPIDPMLLPNGNFNPTATNGLENIHLHVPRPVVNVNGLSSQTFFSSSGSYTSDFGSASNGYLTCSVSNTRALSGQALIGPGQAGPSLSPTDDGLVGEQALAESKEQVDSSAVSASA